MARTLICYTPDSRGYLRWIERGQPSERPSDIPFWLPDDSKKGDRYLLFVGGRDQVYVGAGRVLSSMSSGRSGAWKGVPVATVTEAVFREPVPADDVFAATGFRPPREAKEVHADLAAKVWKVARGRPLSSVERALEGIVTESRSKSRNPALRRAALERAKNVCECCGNDFSRLASGKGTKCLVVHHKKQLKDTDQPRESDLNDLAVVCANCHMMIHSNSQKALKVSALRKLLQ